MPVRRTTWKSEVAKLIRQKWLIDEKFTLDQICQFENHFRNLYPANNHIRQKICEMMQQLRDEDGLVEFVDNLGTYRRISQ
jgi:Dam-replacing family.